MEQTIIAKNVERLMLEQGKSKQELSFDARLGYTSITYILNGRTSDPRISTLRAIAKGLGVDVAELITEPVEHQQAS